MTATGKGIDISGWQGDVNFDKVKKDGIQFAVIKIGNVYDSKGTLDLDTKFRRNVEECERLSIPYGVYLYTYVRTVDRMKEVMPYVTAELKKTCKKMSAIPCYIDIEEPAVVNGGNVNTLRMIQVFAEAIRSAGYKAGVYSSTSWWNSYMTDDWYNTIDKWCADWSSHCDLTRPYTMWQYADNGIVSGISGKVDMNYAYFDFNGKKEYKLPDKEQIYTVENGDTWNSVGKKFGMNHGGVYLLEYNNYANASAELAKKKITQKTIKIPARWAVGDANGDGKVTAADARKILRTSAKLEKTTAAERMHSDVDGDGKITSKDARTTLKKSAKLEDK